MKCEFCGAEWEEGTLCPACGKEAAAQEEVTPAEETPVVEQTPAAEEPAEEALRLLLNALHYLAEGSRPLPLIKAVTELRLLCLAGYMPSVAACAGCGTENGAWFSPLQGVLLCDTCHGSVGAVPVAPSVLAALRHIVYAPFERCFAFSLPEADIMALGDVAERFLLAQLGRSFNTLEFYHSLT